MLDFFRFFCFSKIDHSKQTHLKAIVIGTHVNVLGASQLKDISQSLEDFGIDERHRYGTKFDAVVDFVIGCSSIRTGKLSQDKVISRRCEPFQRTGVFSAGLCQAVFMLSCQWGRHIRHW